ncbi:E3 ubiquitin-protein ligase XBAT33-like [Hibiscus syriacus]|uniref:E3 ubiquitin-protein ligase XBAT33-like n=1 Tax=Hibiscus syriacus TaxID=106335 RepID=UPI0019208419|nr:E3 ubiquitin-protein ligase XBAT33-like [Hibiscus syriacus]
MWGRHWLEPLLASNSDTTIPRFPSSNYLSLPLLSVLNMVEQLDALGFINWGAWPSFRLLFVENVGCSPQQPLQMMPTLVLSALRERVVLLRKVPRSDQKATGLSHGKMPLWRVQGQGSALINSFIVSRCRHGLCVSCALYLCSTSQFPSDMVAPTGSIPCPLCRHAILSFVKLPSSPRKEIKLQLSFGLCTPCMLHPRNADCPSQNSEIRKNRVSLVSSDIFCRATCSPFPSVAIPLCTCNDSPCPSFEHLETAETQEESLRRSQVMSIEQDKIKGSRLERRTCSSMFWGRRSCSREHQCNSEINA